MKVFPTRWLWASVLCAWLLVGPAARAQQAGSVDPSFGASLGLAGGVSQVVLQPDGKVLVAGGFTGIIRLNIDGGVDTSFNPGTGTGSANVTAMVLQGDGKVLIGGSFTTYNSIASNGVARLNGDGSLDATFNPGSGATEVGSMALQVDGKILVGGSFSAFNGVTRRGLVRLNADGSVDADFNTDVQYFVGDPLGVDVGSVVAIAVQSDGRILVGGDYTGISNVGRNGIARLNADGSLDTTFDPGTATGGRGAFVGSIALQNDGKILLGGGFGYFNGVPFPGIVRVNGDGSVDATFAPTTSVSDPDFVGVQPDGKILVIGGGFGISVLRLNADGSTDSTFTPGTGLSLGIQSGGGGGADAALQPDGKILLCGPFSLFDGATHNGIVRVNADGSVDNTFQADIASGPNSAINQILLQSDGSIIIGGAFTSINGAPHAGIARLRSDGSLDAGFASPSDTPLARQSNDKIIVFGGSFGLARLNADGTQDTSFVVTGSGGGGTFGGITTVGGIGSATVQNDDKIVVTGRFTAIDGVARTDIARLNADGSLDTSFNADYIPSPELTLSYITAVVAQPDGQTLIGGLLGAFGQSQPYNLHLARLNADGSLDTGFKPVFPDDFFNFATVQPDGRVLVVGDDTNVALIRLNADGSKDATFQKVKGAIDAVAVQADGRIIVVGGFTTLLGTACGGIARLNADGTLDTTFNARAGANGEVQSLTVQGDGKILVGGDFNSFGGAVRNYIARLNADGSVDPTFVAGEGVPNIATLALQPDDGRVVVGGSFTDVDGMFINALARLNTDGSLDGTFTPGLASGDTVDAVGLQPDDGAVLAADEPAAAATPAVSDDDSSPRPRATKAIHNPIIRCGKVDGAIDVTFNAYTDGKTYAIAGLAGRLTLLAGGFSNVDGTPHAGLARLAPDGSLDIGFVATTDTTARALSVLSANGTIIVGGDFAQVDGVPRSHVARLNADGSLDASFDPGIGPNGSVNTVYALANGQALIGGSFTSVDGTARNGIALLNADGALNASFVSSGTAATAATRRGAHTTAAEAVPAVVINSLDVQPGDGKVIIGGLFDAVDGVTRPNVARLNVDGSVDMTFDPGTGTNAAVNVLQLQPDGRTLLGGGFSDVDGLERRGAARLLGDNDAAAVPTVTIVAGGDGMAVEGGEKGRVVVRRTGDASAALIVRYKVKGSARAGVDFKALPGTVTIPAGSAQVKIKIKPIDNPTADGTRLAKIKLLPATDGSYNLGTATVAKVKVINQD